MIEHQVVGHKEWLAAREKLLVKEKEFTKIRDDLSRQRRQLPWEAVDKDYRFDSTRGILSLPQLFAGRGQLLIYHFMLAPTWEEGCKSCSFWADNFDGVDIHLAHRDVTFLAVSRAPLARIQAYKKRMGWRFDWVSSEESDFNFDYGVSFKAEQVERQRGCYNYVEQKVNSSEMPGFSAFRMEDGKVFHTYSCYSRGIDLMNGAYNLLDLMSKGRDEEGLQYDMSWVRRHDQYDE
jgi:predicted dithiol-disulfide oxidoreductase (DUF899 family)